MDWYSIPEGRSGLRGLTKLVYHVCNSVNSREILTDGVGRAAKKKCDEQQPTCQRCQNRHVECKWEVSRKNTPTSSRASSPQPCKALQRRSVERKTELPLSVGRAINAVPLADVGDISSSYLWDLARLSNHVLHGAYFDDGYSLLPLSMPILSDSPAYMNMWLSLSAMRIAQQSSSDNRWLGAALRHHNKALQALGKHLSSSKPPEDWVLCTILLLHIFEKFGSAEQPPSFAHLAVARPLFLQRYAKKPPTTIHQILQIESLIYRIAITCIFHREASAEYEAVSELIALCDTSRMDCDLWRHSLWIGLPASLFDVVYKLSFLLRCWPLPNEWLDELDELEGRLIAHQNEKQLVFQEQSDRDRVIAEQSYASLQLYTSACFILLAKLRRGKEIPVEQGVSAPGFEIIEHLTKSNFMSPVLLWAVAVIGLAAATDLDRDIIRQYVNGLEPYSGLRATRSVLALLHSAWVGDGTDALFNDILLSNTFI